MFFRDLAEHCRHKKEAERRKTACRNLAAGVAIGALLGVTMGMLFAPKSGKETRKLITEKTADSVERIKQLATEYAEEIKSKLSHTEKSPEEAEDSD
ncbi:MAG TPA: YtxH domain-containing protein [Candidatus Limnocylindrales bacterium]|nr:YtxH domain-containing protein [Candidatus Limnocylindrales bacterium]